MPRHIPKICTPSLASFFITPIKLSFFKLFIAKGKVPTPGNIKRSELFKTFFEELTSIAQFSFCKLPIIDP